MRATDQLKTLRGLVDLRRLQVRAAETKVARAATDRAAAASRAEEGAVALAADEEQWHGLATRGRFDPDATGRWARAICQGAERGVEQTASLDAARRREADARSEWQQALAHADAADARLDDTTRAVRRREDEAALHRTAERHMAVWGRRG